MNEKFGFLSHFSGVKVNLKNKNPTYVTPKHGELSDNPPTAGNQEFLLTDDDSDSDDGNAASGCFAPLHPVVSSQDAAPVMNRIFESSSSSCLNDPDKTFCSELESQENIPKSQSEPIRSSTDLNAYKSARPNLKIADTIIASMSDELCSQMSGMEVEKKQRKEPKAASKLADTVVGSFDDDSDVEDFEPIVNPPPKARRVFAPRPSLPDTIIGFSESMSQLSIMRESANVSDGEEADDDDENASSSGSDDVITILDSDEENEASRLDDEDQPPVHITDQSFVNCSSVASSAKTRADTDNTLNNFFNHPPTIGSPQRVITHSEIRRVREVPAMVHAEKPESDQSGDRLQLLGEAGNDSSSIDEDLELPQTDVSENHQQEGDEESQEQLDESHHQQDDSRKDADVQEQLNDSQQHEESQEQLDDTREHLESPPVISKASNSLVPSQMRSTDHFHLSQSSSYRNIVPTINISAKISFNLKITMRDSSDTSTSGDSSTCSSNVSSNDSPPPAREKASETSKETPKARVETPKVVTSSKKVVSARKEKQAAIAGSPKTIPRTVTTPQAALLNLPRPDEDFRTPDKAKEIVIDDDLQAILNDVYGEDWKTPQLLKSCRSKSVREDLRKSIYSNNFDNFVKNLPKDLESTRIGASIGDGPAKALDGKKKLFKTPSSSVKKKKPADETPESSKKNAPSSSAIKTPAGAIAGGNKKTPSSSVKKTPAPISRRLKGASSTPRYLEICDPDTPSEESSDDDFNPNDTWNASSDDDVEEEERIRRRTIARQSQKFEEIIFIPVDDEDAKAKKIDDVLDRFEYKKPPGMLEVGSAKKVSKRKLFTHTHYDESPVVVDDAPAEPVEEKENDENLINIRDAFFPRPFPVVRDVMKVPTPSPDVKKLPTPSPTIKKTPKAVVQPPKPGRLMYSFLKSLDVEANPLLCDPDAIHFRKNFKSKKAELTVKLFQLYDEKVFDKKLADVSATWNKKLLNTAGRCNNSRKSGERRSHLELSDKVLTSADRLRCTLIHEMCHAATWIINGENGHGPTWKRWAAKANATFPELPKIGVCHNYVIEYKFTYQCTSCKAKYQTHSRSKKVENIRCSICRGSIELFLNKKDKTGAVVMTPVAKEVRGFPKFVKLRYKEVKRPNMTHKEVMQVLSAEFALLSVEEKQKL